FMRWRFLFASSGRGQLVCGTMIWRQLMLCGMSALLGLTARSAGTNSLSDDAFLNEVERRSFLFFLKETEPTTGLVPDRAGADGSWRENVASVAATGFGLAALCVGAERGWMPRAEALARAVTTVKFARDRLAQEHGFLFHFVNREMGDRVWACEVSPMDTALFLCGALTARQYFKDPALDLVVNAVYARVDWRWMLDGGARYIPMGFVSRNVIASNLIYTVPGASMATFGFLTYLQYAPLFVHQFSHAFVDFRDRHDDYADYWRNSELATRAQRQLCLDLREKFPHYGPDCWGITASDSPTGYRAWGGPPPTPDVDGTVVPSAAGGSLPFAPVECLAVLRNITEKYGARAWKPYGFVDAFNPQTGWYSPDVLGIDVGILLLMAENQRSGLIWRAYMSAPEVQRGLQRARFRRTTPQLAAAWPSTTAILPGGRLEHAPTHDQSRVARARQLPRLEQDWEWQALSAASACERTGEVSENFSARFAFAWDAEALHFHCEVFETAPTNACPPEQLAEQDSIELFLAPERGGFAAGATNALHLGFALGGKDAEWFGDRRAKEVIVQTLPTGYRVSAVIPWSLLGVTPKAGLVLSCTPVANDCARPGDPPGRLFWRYHTRGTRTELGTLTLDGP
ncbi:MAG: hypothetical protein NTY53_06735, partial [Kiritimatiellaeota bacterium]|nr:hypothetical protein [Kiritimatiellota bacterium]